MTSWLCSSPPCVPRLQPAQVLLRAFPHTLFHLSGVPISSILSNVNLHMVGYVPFFRFQLIYHLLRQPCLILITFYKYVPPPFSPCFILPFPSIYLYNTYSICNLVVIYLSTFVLFFCHCLHKGRDNIYLAHNFMPPRSPENVW